MSSVLIEKRRQKLRKAIRAKKADALLVTNFTNVTYLTGFTGDDSYLLVTLDDATLVTDGRYEAQLADECPDLPLVVRGVGDKMLPTVAEAVQEAGISRLAVEADSMTLATSAELREVASGVELVSSSGLVELLRQVKDKGEVEATREACTQARRAFEVVRAGLTPDQTEAQVAADLEHQVRRFGGKGLSFDPIIAVGDRSALPHASAGMKRFGESPFALFDWGANSGLYVSDFTRMVFLGKPPARLRKIYDVVLEAQLAAIDAIAPGRKCSDIDAVARKIISKAGFGNQFNHGLGHGTGLEIHEGPRFSMNSEDELKPGMIMTVEPGVYFAGFGGVRIEDDILVTRSGHEVLSSVPKTWDDCFVG